MDDCLPHGWSDASTLRMLLPQERSRREELEQEVARLQAALARQNEVILRLERRDAERQREVQRLQTLVAGLTEQNTLLRQQVALLQTENARLRGGPRGASLDPEPEVKPATPTREPKTRKKRDPRHNAGRHRMEHATRWETHAEEQCPPTNNAAERSLRPLVI